MNAKGSMALFLLCPNLGWIQGHFTFTEFSLRYQIFVETADEGHTRGFGGKYEGRAVLNYSK